MRQYSIRIRVVRFDGVSYLINYKHSAQFEWRAKIHAHSIAEKYRSANKRADIVSIIGITT